jgi:hypothetical protein
MTPQIKLTYVMQWIAVFTLIAAIGTGHWAFTERLYCLALVNVVIAFSVIGLFIAQGRIRARWRRLVP